MIVVVDVIMNLNNHRAVKVLELETVIWTWCNN